MTLIASVGAIFILISLSYVSWNSRLHRYEVLCQDILHTVHSQTVDAGYIFAYESFIRLIILTAGVSFLIGMMFSPIAAAIIPVMVGASGYVYIGRKARQFRYIQSQKHEDACFALARYLRSGQRFHHSLETISDQYSSIDILSKTRSLLQSGITVGVVIDNIHHDAQNQHDILFAASLVYAYELGENSAKIFERIGEYFRHVKTVSDDVKAGLAQVNLSTLVIAVLPLAMVAFGFLTGSEASSFLFIHPLGWTCLFFGVLLQYAGIMWMKSLVRKGVGIWVS